MGHFDAEPGLLHALADVGFTDAFDGSDLRALALQSGTVLPDAKLAYKTYGTLSPARDKALMLGDNMHPNAKGVKVVAKGLAPLVEQALPDAG